MGMERQESDWDQRHRCCCVGGVADSIFPKSHWGVRFESRTSLIFNKGNSVRIPKVKDQVITKKYAIYNGDCIEVLKGINSNSIHFSCFSPPFADLYSYSDHAADLSNCHSYDDFFRHFEFVVKELKRIMMPGRVVAVHCMDLPTYKNKGEEIGIKDFPGDIVRLFQKHDFIYHSHHCIWKDPLIAATRTHAIGLAHQQIVKDSAMCRMGIADYIVAFRKEGENPEPIKHPMGLTEYAGTDPIPRNLDRFVGWEEQGTNKRSHWIWQKYASPVWSDIDQTGVLPYKKGREKDDQRHICPLQRQTIARCLILWSNPEDTVLSPFCGVGSEIYEAVRLGRKGIGIELKFGYYKQARRNLEDLSKIQSRKGFTK
jgi:DNA modification methylase